MEDCGGGISGQRIWTINSKQRSLEEHLSKGLSTTPYSSPKNLKTETLHSLPLIFTIAFTTNPSPPCSPSPSLASINLKSLNYNPEKKTYPFALANVDTIAFYSAAFFSPHATSALA